MGVIVQMGTVNNLLRTNNSNGGGNNTVMYIIICICCMCLSYSVGAALILWFNRDKDPFMPHNEDKMYWGSNR